MNELVNIGGRWYWALVDGGLQELTSYELQELELCAD